MVYYLLIIICLFLGFCPNFELGFCKCPDPAADFIFILDSSSTIDETTWQAAIDSISEKIETQFPENSKLGNQKSKMFFFVLKFLIIHETFGLFILGVAHFASTSAVTLDFFSDLSNTGKAEAIRSIEHGALGSNFSCIFFIANLIFILNLEI